MLTEGLIREHLDVARNSLDGWAEPDGYLVPTEPDPRERGLIRERLRAAIFAYRRVLETVDEGLVSQVARRMGLFESPSPVRDQAVGLLREWAEDGRNSTPCDREPPCTMCRTRAFLERLGKDPR